MKLLLVSNFSDIPDEHYVLNLLFCEGLEHFHLRKCDYSLSKMVKYIERIPEPFRKNVVLHSHFELIEEFGLKGGHFTKKYSYEDFLKSRGQDSVLNEKPYFSHLGFSLHSLNEIKKVSPVFDYLFLSPIFDSISNQGYNSKFRINDLKTFLTQHTNRPEIIALGGINDQVIDKVFDIGFDGLALLGFIWTFFENTQDILATVKRFQLIKKLIETKKTLPELM